MSTTADKNPRRTRRSFSDEYKAGAVRLVLDEGKSVAAAARDLDLERAWDIQPAAGSTITVAVLDTGIAYTNDTMRFTAGAFPSTQTGNIGPPVTERDFYFSTRLKTLPLRRRWGTRH